MSHNPIKQDPVWPCRHTFRLMIGELYLGLARILRITLVEPAISEKWWISPVENWKTFALRESLAYPKASKSGLSMTAADPDCGWRATTEVQAASAWHRCSKTLLMIKPCRGQIGRLRMWCGDCFQGAKPYGSVNGGDHDAHRRSSTDRKPLREISDGQIIKRQHMHSIRNRSVSTACLTSRPIFRHNVA